MSRRRVVLVTGIAGFIGYHLGRRLLREGNRVVGVDDLNGYYDPSLKKARLSKLERCGDLVFAQQDISEQNATVELFDKYEPNVIVHLAAQAGVRYSLEDPNSYVRSNVIGFHNILEGCRSMLNSGRHVEHLVYASSSSVYGGNSEYPYRVSAMTDRPLSLYAATKKSTELFAYCYSRLYGIPTTGLRFFTVYGPWGRPDMAYFSFTERMVRGEAIQIFNNGDMRRDFTYVDDIVEGVTRVIDGPPCEDSIGVRHRVYNIGNSSAESLQYFVDTLESKLRLKGLISRPATREYLPMQKGDVLETFADVSDLERDFGFRPCTPLDQGLEMFVDWFSDYLKMKEDQSAP